VPQSSAFEFELPFEKQKSYKSSGIDQIPAELIKAGGRTIRYEIHKFIMKLNGTHQFLIFADDVI